MYAILFLCLCVGFLLILQDGSIGPVFIMNSPLEEIPVQLKGYLGKYGVLDTKSQALLRSLVGKLITLKKSIQTIGVRLQKASYILFYVRIDILSFVVSISFLIQFSSRPSTQGCILHTACPFFWISTF